MQCIASMEHLAHPYLYIESIDSMIIICSALFRNLRFLQKVLRFLGIPRKRNADLNVRAHTRWMRSCSIPSPSPGRCCHFDHDPLGQPDTVRAPTVSDARHGSDTARQRVPWCAIYRKRAILYGTLSRKRSAFYRKRIFLKSAKHNNTCIQ